MRLRHGIVVMTDETRIRADAIDWLIRQRDPAFVAWDDFADWLENDPAHVDIYQAAAAADADMADLIGAAPPPPMTVMPSPPVTRRRFGGWIGGAVAASLVAITGYGLLPPRSDPYSIATMAGERRTVTLADGSRIDINGATRITLDRRNPRLATLESGEVLFTVVHDDSRPFIVHAGGAELRDVGTVFNVVSDDSGLALAVAEGTVIYNPKREAVTIDAGNTLRVRAGDPVVTVGRADPAAMVSWRQNRLIYDGAPLGLVAADIRRNLGLAVAVSPDVAARPFRGVIVLDRETDRFLARLGPLLDVTVERGPQGWVLAAKTQ